MRRKRMRTEKAWGVIGRWVAAVAAFHLLPHGALFYRVVKYVDIHNSGLLLCAVSITSQGKLDLDQVAGRVVSAVVVEKKPFSVADYMIGGVGNCLFFECES